MAWGYDQNENFQQPWANKFPDSHASSSFLDIFYNGALVFRTTYVIVDGGRTYLPVPNGVWDEQKKSVVGYEVPRRRFNLIRLLDSLEKISSFDEDFGYAEFTVVDEPWPERR